MEDSFAAMFLSQQGLAGPVGFAQVGSEGRSSVDPSGGRLLRGTIPSTDTNPAVTLGVGRGLSSVSSSPGLSWFTICEL